MTEEIEYHPMNVKDVLKEMKDTSELMVDLAYSAVLYDDEDIAEEVLRLEEKMDVLGYHARIAAMLGARGVEEAEMLSGILQIASAAEKVSNAAGDIAKIVLKKLGLPPELKAAIPEAEETVTRVRTSSKSPLAGKTLGELELETETGMRVIAMRRDLDWIYGPDKETMVMRDDILFAKGPDEGVEILYELAVGDKYQRKSHATQVSIEDLDKAVDMIIDMKNVSELAVGLAYSAVLFYNEEIAHEVEILEAKMDEMKYGLEHWVLVSAKHVTEVDHLRGLLHLAISSEVISDAADEIADVVLRDIELHPVFMLAVRESDEVITRVTVSEQAEIIGKTLGDLRLETETGMFVMAIRRADRWLYSPKGKTIIERGDTLIARGTRGGEELLMGMCSGPESESSQPI
ncbi:MAG: TrkA C-terminal domain-containing protein [Methanocellales archaeon]|nr:TrkA C-terminal domain-containing protein [Methanocellales archaeon]MDD3292369.1 TrkA C-terminal domain-containing protein [Methanocellales archaeon]MDD5236031.1 TrkA C-terminal domain-containing protein [Methanocellales archaeon]MDD5485857.1 TrkA C-terminal domain-containing protein [Methanocellales archaeon]